MAEQKLSIIKWNTIKVTKTQIKGDRNPEAGEKKSFTGRIRLTKTIQGTTVWMRSSQTKTKPYRTQYKAIQSKGPYYHHNPPAYPKICQQTSCGNIANNDGL